MKAKISQLELNAYFVTGLGFTANPEFDPAKPSQLGFSDLEIDVHAFSPGSAENPDPARWRVTLSVKQNVGPEKNSPYNFFIDIQGAFTPRGPIPPEHLHGFMENTGGSVLYGTAREVLRSALATGPYRALILPAVVFIPNGGDTAHAKTSISSESPAPTRALPKPASAKKLIRRRTASK